MILKDSVIYLIGEIFAKIFPFLLLPYLSRKLGVNGFGELSYYQTILSLLIIIISFSQEGAVARYFYFYGKRSINLILFSGYAYALLIGSVGLLFCYFFHSEILAYLILISIFQTFLTVQLCIKQCQKKAILYTLIQIGSALLTTLLTVLFLEFSHTDLVGKRFLALFLGNLIIFILVYFSYFREYRRKSFNIAEYQKGFLYFLGFGIPLAFHQISMFIKGQLDRVFIYNKFTESELGLYAMGAQVALVLAVIIQAINKATIPYFYEALKQKKITLHKVHQLSLLSLLLIPIPSIIMWIIPEEFVILVLGEQFWGTKYYIIMFLITTMFSVPYLILVNYLFFYGKNKWISLCSILSTILYLGGLSIFMQFGVEYVPFASILGAGVILPFLYVMTSRVK